MKALILAGGQGDRLGSLTDRCPKSLVKVCGKELITYTLDFLKDPLFSEIGVVVGYQAPLLIDFIMRKNPSARIFETPHFDKGSLLGIQCALPFLDDDFILLNADHIYPKRLLNKFLQDTRNITIACDFDRVLVADDMKIKKNTKGHLAQIHKELKTYDGGYIGMTYCPRSKLSTYLNAHETTLAKKGPKASVEMILGELAAQREFIHIVDTSGVRWLEVDTLGDLEKAEVMLQKNPKFLD